MIGVIPLPHKSALLTAKAEKAAREMKHGKHYQNSCTNGRRTPTEQVVLTLPLTAAATTHHGGVGSIFVTDESLTTAMC